MLYCWLRTVASLNCHYSVLCTTVRGQSGAVRAVDGACTKHYYDHCTVLYSEYTEPHTALHSTTCTIQYSVLMSVVYCYPLQVPSTAPTVVLSSQTWHESSKQGPTQPLAPPRPVCLTPVPGYQR